MQNIKLDKAGEIAKITLSKPPLNIFGTEDLRLLPEIFDEISYEPGIKAITIESDQKVFSAGVDIAEHSKNNMKLMLKAFHKVFFKMLELEIPTISLVKSSCIGGGCELALFSDFVLASQKAYFSQPEIKIGCFPSVSLVYFPYITGHKKALEMILTGNKILAEEALGCGLINQVFPEENFDAKAQEFIDSIIFNSPSVLKTTLNTYKKLHYPEIRKKLACSEKAYFEELIHLEDAGEGIRSFLEKRPPVWVGK